jgi:hypothetical protein
MIVVTYDKATGLITGAHEIHGNADDYMARVAEIGQGAMKLGIDGATFYVDVGTGVLKTRPDNGIRLSKQTVSITNDERAKLSGLPAGATIRIVGPFTQQFVAEDTSIRLTFGMPGRYDVFVEAFPYRDFVSNVEATP